jgi:hypothetical protein
MTTAPWRTEDEVGPLKGGGLRGAYRHIRPPEGDRRARGPFTRERPQLPDRELALLEHLKQDLSDGAGCADDGDYLLLLLCAAHARAPIGIGLGFPIIGAVPERVKDVRG